MVALNLATIGTYTAALGIARGAVAFGGMALGGAGIGAGIAYAAGGNVGRGAMIGAEVTTGIGALSPRLAAAGVELAGRVALRGVRATGRGIGDTLAALDEMAGAGLGMQTVVPVRWGRTAVSVPRTALRSADEVYAGVRQASQMMREMGISRSVRKQVLESFDVRTLRVRTAAEAEFAIRYFDKIDAFPRGRFLFETFPASRDSLALQIKWNQMTGFKQWQLRAGATVFEGATAPKGVWQGGQTQKYVFDPVRDLLEP